MRIIKILLIISLLSCNKHGKRLFDLVDREYHEGRKIINLEVALKVEFDNIYISTVPFSDKFISKFTNFYEFFPNGLDLDCIYIVFEKDRAIVCVEKVDRSLESQVLFDTKFSIEDNTISPTGDLASSNIYHLYENQKIFKITIDEDLMYLLTKP
jgi:hypothetical protein